MFTRGKKSGSHGICAPAVKAETKAAAGESGARAADWCLGVKGKLTMGFQPPEFGGIAWHNPCNYGETIVRGGDIM